MIPRCMNSHCKGPLIIKKAWHGRYGWGEEVICESCGMGQMIDVGDFKAEVWLESKELDQAMFEAMNNK